MSSETEYPCVPKHGSSRSVVRLVGDRLPIRTGTRLYIQLTSASAPSTPGMEVRYAATGERLSQDLDGLRALTDLKAKDDSEYPFHIEPITEDGLEEASLIENEEDVFDENSSEGEGGNPKLAIEKISALESELAKLKAQIAVYALAETRDLPPVPAPPPPPPPPPGIPPPQIASARQVSHNEASSTTETKPLVTPARPPMNDMLRDLGSVKLRTVHAVKSPGGTPIRPQNTRTQEPIESDPASIIATALRKKFANRVFQDSPDKENQSELSMSEFDSPNVRLQFN